jgi:hypothetical protein
VTRTQLGETLRMELAKTKRTLKQIQKILDRLREEISGDRVVRNGEAGRERQLKVGDLECGSSVQPFRR